MRKLLRTSLLLITGLLISNSFAVAQQQAPPQPEPLSPEEVTDEHLQMLVGVSMAAEEIQQKADQEMRATLKEEGMDFSRFQQIMMAQQNPQSADSMELSEEEELTLQKVQPKLMQITQDARQQYMTAIKDQGMSIQEFQQVAQAVQAHPEVAKRYEAKLAESKEDEGNN